MLLNFLKPQLQMYLKKLECLWQAFHTSFMFVGKVCAYPSGETFVCFLEQALGFTQEH